MASTRSWMSCCEPRFDTKSIADTTPNSAAKHSTAEQLEKRLIKSAASEAWVAVVDDQHW